MVDVARDDEGQAVAGIALRRKVECLDGEFLLQSAIAGQVLRIAEPRDELRRLLGADAVDVGKDLGSLPKPLPRRGCELHIK